MEEIRCISCNKLLLKVREKKAYWIEIKCPKCKTLQTLGRSEIINFKNAVKESV